SYASKCDIIYFCFVSTQEAKMKRRFILGMILTLSSLTCPVAAQPPKTKAATEQAPKRVDPTFRPANPRAKALPITSSAAQANLSKLTSVSGVPAGFWWDSGEQQCQSGSRKLVYQYRMQPSAMPGFQWELWVHVKSEDTDWNGKW